jgi:hypothetical protein
MIASIHADHLLLGTLNRWRFTQGVANGTEPTPEFTPLLGHQLAHGCALVENIEDPYHPGRTRRGQYSVATRGDPFWFIHQFTR